MGFAASLGIFQTLLPPLSEFLGKVADQLSAGSFPGLHTRDNIVLFLVGPL